MGKKYEKPIVQVVDGVSEGVFAASGANCDCFEVKGVFERPNAGNNYYACNYEIHYVDGATHMNGIECWNNLKVDITFNQNIPAGATINPANGVASGNIVTVSIDSIIPAKTGNLSYNFIEIKGEGVNSLKAIQFDVHH